MKKQDLDALAGLYEGLYSPAESGEYLIEAPQVVPAAARLNQQTTRSKPGESAADARSRASAIEDSRRGSIFGQAARTLTRGFGSNKDIAKIDAADKASQARINQRVAASQGKYYSSSDGKTYKNYNDAVAARNSRLSANKKPPITPQEKPAETTPAKPVTTGTGAPGSGSKVAPSSAPKPAATTPAKPAGSAMDQWRAANPKLAAAADEKARIRGTSQTDNPLMKDMRSKMSMTPSVQSPEVAKLGAGNQSLVNNPNASKAAPPKPNTASTAFSQNTPALRSSSPAVQSAGSAAAAKPTTNQTATAFSSPSLARPTPSTTPIRKPGAVMASFEWGSKATLKDVASLYSSIYEAKKKDQDQDGDNDFADVRIARMIASGMSRAEAIAAVKNKEYNEEYELDEAAKRTPKKVRGAKDPVAYMKGRSDAGKRISGDEDTGPRHYTLGRARGAAVDAPTAPGARPKNTPKLASWEKDDIQYRKANLKAGRTHKVGGEKGLPEEYQIYEIVASYLLENNFAETLNDANAIIENMSENWLEEIIEQSAIASRAAAVVDDQRRGSHGMAHDQKMTGDSIKKLNRYKGPRVTPGLPGV